MNQFHRYPLVVAAVWMCQACATVPPDYVPDQKVVFLMQNTDFGPISYPAVPAEPYDFTSSAEGPGPDFLNFRWDAFLKADAATDRRIYTAARAAFQAQLNRAEVRELRNLLDRGLPPPPEDLAPDHGEKTKDYSNGAEYDYPQAPGAKITLLNSGIQIITWSDGSQFQRNPDGTRFWKDAQGRQTQFYDAKTGAYAVQKDGVLWESGKDFRAVKDARGRLEFTEKPEPQYTFLAPEPGVLRYTYFVDADGTYPSCTVTNQAGLRFDWMVDHQAFTVNRGAEVVTFRADSPKVHETFDQKTRKPGEVLSVYFPEGVRLSNLAATTPVIGELTPAWPEAYKKKTLGPFDVWYTTQDEPLLGRLQVAQLTALEAQDRALTGLGSGGRHAVVIPPNLESYRRLHAQKPHDVLSWYPSGFETMDYIVLWPLSVPRYSQPAGQDYFFNTEVYEILTHEYVHALVGENSGMLQPVPVWLNEGLAVAVESQRYPEARKYWETTFRVARDQDRLLDWETVTLRGTGEFPVATARTHYAQSYGLVSHLLARFGPAKMAAYVQSFRVKGAQPADMVSRSQAQFQTVFGITWNQGLEMLKTDLPTPKL